MFLRKEYTMTLRWSQGLFSLDVQKIKGMYTIIKRKMMTVRVKDKRHVYI